MSRHHLVVAVATSGLAAAAPLCGQTTGTLDIGASLVRYDGFLASGAAYVAPAIRYDAPGLSIGAQGTAVIFESGNSILQGAVAGGFITPANRGVRVEVSGSAGAAAYLDAPRYGHALGKVRIHATRRRHGLWVGTTTGRTFFGARVLTPLELAIGGWMARGGLGAGTTVTRSMVGDTAYTDMVGTARWARGAIVLEAIGGARVWSRGAGSGTYGEITARWHASPRIAASVGGGRYPADPVRGVVAARYGSIGLRLALSPPRPQPRSLAEALDRSDPGAGSERARLSAAAAAPGRWTLQVRAPERARDVEITGDFTDWEPVRLARVDSTTWEIVLPLAPGLYRVNVRLDGGTWHAPTGVRTGEDDFGGTVGILVIG